MRFVIALVRHETNTFSPIETELSRFKEGVESDGPAYGRDALLACRNTESAAAAYLDLAESLGAEVDFAIAANALPSGVVSRQAFDSMVQSIMQSVERGCDAILLDLHGAMVAEGYPDAEGELLRRVRLLAPNVPIAVALDFHANFGRELIRNADVITGYCTYPHIDVYRTGQRAARTLSRVLNKEAEPIILWRRLPMLTHMLKQTPAQQPMKDIMEHAMAAEAQGRVLNASVFGGFPLADIPQAGLSIVIVADRKNSADGEALLEELTQMAWQRRHDFVYRSEPFEQSIASAKKIQEGPVFLVDHGDNCGAGGPTDGMEVLREAMRQGLQDVVAGPFCDPVAVAQLIQVGVGNVCTVDIGGKTDMPALGLKGRPLTVSGRVRTITDGVFHVTGPMYTGMKLSLGRTVVLESQGFQIVVSERAQEPFDAGIFTHAGIDPSRKKYVLIKSRQHFRAGFSAIAKEIILVAGPGVCSSDYSIFPFQHVARPVFPLDPEAPLGAMEQLTQ